MAVVAAGSLVMFSLLAQNTALSPAPGDALLPRGPEDADRPPLIVPAPEATTSAEDQGRPVVPFVVTAFPSAPPPTTAPLADPAAPRTPEPEETLLASLDLRIRVSEALDLRGPLVNLRPRGHDPDDEPRKRDECPGRPTKPRPPGEHPFGGPPACGNPHGGPPGQDKSDPARPAARGNSPDHVPPAPSGSPGGGGASPPTGGSDHATEPGSNAGGNGSSAGNSAGSPPRGSSGSAHPHGGAPGQAKKDGTASSSGGGSDARPDHPHGGPPGKAKK